MEILFFWGYRSAKKIQSVPPPEEVSLAFPVSDTSLLLPPTALNVGSGITA